MGMVSRKSGIRLWSRARTPKKRKEFDKQQLGLKRYQVPEQTHAQVLLPKLLKDWHHKIRATVD